MFCVATPTSVTGPAMLSAPSPPPTAVPNSVTPLRCPTEVQFYTPSSTNLFVRYLPHEVDDERLRQIFSAYGTVTSSMVMRDIHSGASMGNGFVRFATHEEAARAFQEAHGMPLFGKTLAIQWAKQQHDDTPAGQDRLKMNKLFLRNVPLDVTEKDIANLVATYGTVKKVTLHNDTAPILDVNVRRRIVFITFVEDGAAEAALRKLHNSCPFPQCCGVPLMCKLINDAIKSKKHRVCSDSTANQSMEAGPVAAMDAAALPAPATSRALERMGGVRKLSLESLNTCPSSLLVSGTDESSTATTPSRSYGTSQWDVVPAAVTPVGAFSGPIPMPVGTPSSSSSQRGSIGETSHSSRFCHNPYSMGGEKLFL